MITVCAYCGKRFILDTKRFPPRLEGSVDLWMRVCDSPNLGGECCKEKFDAMIPIEYLDSGERVFNKIDPRKVHMVVP